MHETFLKMLIISALRAEPDFSKLYLLRSCSESQIQRLLVWLDQGGLALYLFNRLEQQEVLGALTPGFRQSLERRRKANCERTGDMLNEFSRVNQALNDRGIRYALLKGFTLTPEFCSDPALRSQSDIDLLVAPESVPDAIHALRTCGYTLEGVTPSGEVCLATPLRHVPGRRDDIYALQRHRQIDIHTTIWESNPHVGLVVPADCLNRTCPHSLRGIHFASLSTEDMFLLQVLHAFRHMLRSWMRVSWLFEIDQFVGLHQEDRDLWSAFRTRAGSDPTVRHACALVISLTNQLFRRPIPDALKTWCGEDVPASLEIWARDFGPRWALSNWPGNQLSLLVAKEFIHDQSLRRQYVRSRIFPVHSNLSIGTVQAPDRKTRLQAKASQLLYVGSRLAFHLGALISLSLDMVRWRRTLRSIRSGTNQERIASRPAC
jgi:hypothetical protein